MAELFHPQQPELSFEVGEYQQFHRPKEPDASMDKIRKPSLSWRRPGCMLLLSFGLLCILQAVLNISLRLSATTVTATTTVAVATTAGAAEEWCPPGWLAFGCSCYYVSSQGKSWDDSRSDCTNQDAHLVIINSRREQDFLSSLVEAAWVGMTDREEEGLWLWVDGTRVNRDRLRWAPGQPDGAFGGEDCGDLRNMLDFKGLNDFNCSTRAQWICERPRLSLW